MSKNSEKKPIYITHSGPKLLGTPLLNKGSAFSAQERADFNLSGLIPARHETIDQQVKRAYKQYCSFDDPLNKHIYLRAIQDKNETLFYKLLQTHLEEMMPIVYTPTVGDACERFSDIYRNARGLFVSHTQQDRLDDIFHNATKEKVKIIVVTDGERVLGLGDQGVGGMGISVGKLSLYTVCGGISPAYTLPVVLDVGTNNHTLLDDPMYMGIREKRIGQAAYDEFIDAFMSAAQRRWPGVMIQFEDFAQPNAMPILERYRDKMCCFNDDIQGTATVTLGTLLAACRSKQQKLSQQTVVFAGAGSAGCGIAEQVITWMCKEGLSDLEARRKVFMVDRSGLVTQGMDGLRDFQARLAQHPTVWSQWKTRGDYPSLMEVVENVKPEILVGVSGQANLFTEEMIRNLSGNVPHPIIFPLSNPSRFVEATPEDIINWTEGQAIIATGSPFSPVVYGGVTYDIPQCNNSYIFPGLGLGVLAVGAKRITEEMLTVASETLAAASPSANGESKALLPPITDIARISREIAFAIGKVAQEQGHALSISDEQLRKNIDRHFWIPEYRPYKRCSS
jgi:malate dehydrogenase (oxaloacetate-decarboxylating)